MPKTKLQMLFRGQNILGYKHYADDVVEEFCQKSIENGIDVVRVFDALNDIRNLRKAVESVKKYGGWAEVALSYTVSPVHKRRLLRRPRQGPREDGRRFHLHQGYGEPAAAAARL